MASKSLGALTLDLIARVGGFTQGMDRAERSSARWRRRVETDAKAAGVAIAGMATVAVTASVAAATAGAALLKNTSEQITETDRWAKSLKMNTQDLLAWQYAAEQAGLSGDNIADIFKDINDKVGDAVLNKSGEAAQALDTLGLSAQKLSVQSPDKQLLAIGAALEKIPTQAGKTNILESLGNDLSKMLPLFDDNNAKLKSFIQLSKDFGVAPPQEDIDDLVKVNQFFQDIETQAKGLKIEIASGLAKVDLSPLQDGLDEMKKVFTDPAVLSGLTKLVGGLAELVGWMGKLVSGSANFISQLSEVPDRFKAGGWYEYAKNQKLKSLADTLQSDLGAITTPSLPQVTVNNSLGAGESNQKQTKKPDAEAKKLESAYKALEESYLRQISLSDKLNGKTEEATELEKLRFDITTGKLAGVNEVQQKRLEGLATEIDRLNVLKKFSEMKEDLLTPEEKLLEVTKERVKLLNQARDLGVADPEQYKKAADAISKNSFTDAPKFSGMDALYGGQSGELRKIDDAQKDLDKWYTTQLDMLEKNRQSQSDLNDQWDARELEIKKKHQDEMNKLDDSRSQLMLSSVSDGLGSMVDLTRTAFGEQSGIYKAAFVAQKAVAIAQSMVAIQQGIAMAAANPFPYNLAAMATVAASTAGIVTNIAAIGMAHDGIDSVPETGTWLLQKGERVTTAHTSAKLDATLDRVSKQSTGGSGGGGVTNITIPINGNPSDATIELVRNAAKEGAKQGHAMVYSELSSGTGKVHKALVGGYTARRSTR